MIVKKNHLLLTSLLTSVLMMTACQQQPSEDNSNNSTEHTSQSNDIANSNTATEDTHAHHEHSEQENLDKESHDMTHDHHDMVATTEFQQEYMQGMAKMHDDMMAGMSANDADVAFAKGMLPHHEGAVDMAEVQLKYGKDETMRKLAEDIIKAQKAEIELMQNWIANHPDTDKQQNTDEVQQAYHGSMQAMHDDMMTGIHSDDADVAFAKGMLPHHQGAVAMAEVELKYGKDDAMRKLAEDIIKAQKAEIELMQKWIAEHS